MVSFGVPKWLVELHLFAELELLFQFVILFVKRPFRSRQIDDFTLKVQYPSIEIEVPEVLY